MNPIDRISTGEIKHSVRSHFLSNWYLNTNTKMIPVPVSVVTSLFVFDFEKQIEKIGDFKSRSTESLNRMIKLLSNVLQQLDDAGIKRMLIESGYAASDDEELDRLIGTIRSQVIKSFTNSGIPSAIIKDVFASETTVEVLNGLRDITHSDIQLGIEGTKSLYSRFARSASVEEIVSYVQATFAANKSYKFVETLYRLLTLHSGATIQARLSYVMNQVVQGTMGDQPVVVTEEVLPGIAYKVSSLPYVDELTYKDTVTGFMSVLRTIQGFSTDAGNMEIPISDLIENLVFKTKDFLPAIPQELGVGDITRVDRAITHYWIMRVVERLTTFQYGSVETRINGIMDTRKYSRNDAFDRAVRESISIASVIYESYLDVGAWMKNLAMSGDIHYTDIHPVRRKQFSDLMFTYLEDFKNFTSRVEQSAFLSEGAHVINQRLDFVTITPDWFLPDNSDLGSRIFIDTNDIHVKHEYFKSTQLNGNVMDAPFPPTFSYTWLDHVKSVQPYYSLGIAGPDIFSSRDLFRRSLSIFNYDVLMDRTDISRMLERRGQATRVNTLEELAALYQIPFHLATTLWTGKGWYFELNDPSDILLYWDSAVAPVYEYKDPESHFNVPVFLAEYPALMHRATNAGSQQAGKTFASNPETMAVTTLEFKNKGKKADMQTKDVTPTDVAKLTDKQAEDHKPSADPENPNIVS